MLELAWNEVSLFALLRAKGLPHWPLGVGRLRLTFPQPRERAVKCLDRQRGLIMILKAFISRAGFPCRPDSSPPPSKLEVRQVRLDGACLLQGGRPGQVFMGIQLDQ